ncbi:MAG: hypothetical protein ABL971_10675 [Vicinamibacterales bacterium]
MRRSGPGLTLASAGRAVLAGIVTTVVGGRVIAPVVLAGATTALGSFWMGRWVVRAVLPTLLVAGLGMVAGWMAARWSRGRVRLGVASYAAVAAASGLPQLWGRGVNAWSDSRFQPAFVEGLEQVAMVLVSIAIGGWLYGRDGFSPDPVRVTPESDMPAK